MYVAHSVLSLLSALKLWLNYGKHICATDPLHPKKFVFLNKILIKRAVLESIVLS